MKDTPAIFSAPMVQALLDRRKTMTRRLRWGGRKAADGVGMRESPWARVKPGDRIWVRESHWRWGQWDYQPDRDRKWKFFPEKHDSFAFDEAPGYVCPKRIPGKQAWWCRPSIFMPREFSRLTLIVTATKIERLQDISEEDCLAEGPVVRHSPSWIDGGPMVFSDPKEPSIYCTPRTWYRELWDKLHGPGSWDANPEVVALSFHVLNANVDHVSHSGQIMAAENV